MEKTKWTMRVHGRRAAGAEGTTTTTELIKLVNIAIDAWPYSKNRNGEAVQHVEKWLGILQGKLSSSTTLNRLNPDMLRLYEESYRGVIRTYVCIHDYQNLQKAINLLEDMRTQQEDDLSYPTAHTVNLVHTAWPIANHVRQANAEQDERILTQMVNDCEQQQKNGLKNACYGPDSNTFRQVIPAWTKSGCADMVAKHGSRIINRML